MYQTATQHQHKQLSHTHKTTQATTHTKKRQKHIYNINQNQLHQQQICEELKQLGTHVTTSNASNILNNTHITFTDLHIPLAPNWGGSKPPNFWRGVTY